LTYFLGIDGLSLFFFFLSSLLVFCCIIFVWTDSNFNIYTLNLLIIELFLFLIFSVLDLFYFYIFFESLLIPMFLLIGLEGSRERKIRAVYLFFYYTLCGSIFMLLGILYIYLSLGCLNFEILFSTSFTFTEQVFLWAAFFLSFASKIPMFPLHIWLPEAHVEAPTVGSVLLAGILLKLGVYGFLRFVLPLFPDASLFYSPFVYFSSLFGVIFGSLTAIRQTDLKRIIAYSSVAHMNLICLGIFCFNILGVEGAFLQSLSHGFVSGGLFFLIGTLYNRYHSRFLFFYGGLVHLMPIFSFIFFFFTLANISLPGTSNFIGEFLIFAGIFKTSILICFFSALSVILCGAYSLWLYNKIIYGNLKTTYTNFFMDLTFDEFGYILPLFLLIFILGIYPIFFTNFINYYFFSFSFICL
jgi:proton-translocating NADH-quinone oxidoreductase chain M